MRREAGAQGIQFLLSSSGSSSLNVNSSPDGVAQRPARGTRISQTLLFNELLIHIVLSKAFSYISKLKEF
jgi:hypothetical protein